MSKAYINALAEEGSRQDLIDWIIKLDREVDELQGRINRDFAKEHGERVEARRKDNPYS